MYENRNEPLLSRAAFLLRLARHSLLAFGLVAGSLFVGMAGYHFLEGLSWIDSLVNAAMLLGGMGPVNPLHSNAGKLFASFYALYAGMIFLIVAGLMFAPVFHRFMHRFHLDMESDDDSKED